MANIQKDILFDHFISGMEKEMQATLRMMYLNSCNIDEANRRREMELGEPAAFFCGGVSIGLLGVAAGDGFGDRHAASPETQIGVHLGLGPQCHLHDLPHRQRQLDADAPGDEIILLIQPDKQALLFPRRRPWDPAADGLQHVIGGGGFVHGVTSW